MVNFVNIGKLDVVVRLCVRVSLRLRLSSPPTLNAFQLLSQESRLPLSPLFLSRFTLASPPLDGLSVKLGPPLFLLLPPLVPSLVPIGMEEIVEARDYDSQPEGEKEDEVGHGHDVSNKRK